MCSGAVILYNIPRVVIGENTTLMGAEGLLECNGVEVVVLNDVGLVYAALSLYGNSVKLDAPFLKEVLKVIESARVGVGGHEYHERVSVVEEGIELIKLAYVVYAVLIGYENITGCRFKTDFKTAVFFFYLSAV